MKQTKYQKWIADSFVPTVKHLMGTSQCFTNSQLRKELRDNTHMEIVKNCNAQYRKTISGKVSSSQIKWNICDYSDRMSRALDEAIAQDFLICKPGIRIKVGACTSWPHYRTIRTTYRALASRQAPQSFGNTPASVADPAAALKVMTLDSDGQETIGGDLATLDVTVVRSHEDNIVTIRLPDKRLIDIDCSWLTLAVD